MKALYRKIAQIMKNKILRKRLRRYISVIAVIVVFVTTYATVLPAITLEKTASCGIEEHQHNDDCYEERLSCGQEESEGHHHDESCYTVTKELVCQEKEHQHSEENGCYDEEGNLICELSEHVHDDSCYEEVETLTCSQEESEGHHHTDACYEKVLVCGKDEHTHSVECYEAAEETAEVNTEDTSADTTPENAAEDNSAASEAELTTEEAQPQNGVPELDPVELETLLGKHTGFYYYHPEEGEEVPESSSEITEWQELKDDTVLASEDLVRVYLPYIIPAGSLNATNPIARYRLPGNIHLDDEQIKAINKNKNGFYYDYKNSSEDADKYLGAEAIEGSRTPDQNAGDEYISATVKAENVYKDGDYVGQDLIFNFIPYTIEKNQISYDNKGEVISEGKDVKGFFTFDLNTSQIDFEETEKETVEKEDVSQEDIQYSEAEVVFVKEDKDKDIYEIRRTLTMAAHLESEEPQTQEPKTLTSEGPDYTVTVSYTSDAQIPENAELSVSEIKKDDDNYNEYLQQAKDTVEKDKAVNEARFFDITILADGEKIEPQAPVSVQISFAGIEQANTDDTQLLHYTDDKEVEVIDKAEFSNCTDEDSKEKEAGRQNTVDTVRFEAESFSVYGVVSTGLLKSEVITANGEICEVTVTYGPEAHIPENSVLVVKEIENGSDDYISARNAVLASRKAKGLEADISTLGLAALDISIHDPEGREIEPETEVQVEMKIKKLPGVEDLSAISSSMEIQHHVKSENGIIVDTVSENEKDASFGLSTDSEILEEKEEDAVDPDAVNEENFNVHKKLEEEAATEASKQGSNDEAGDTVRSFYAPSFSIFTITWNKNQKTINGISGNGQYVIYAKDISDGKYYALKPGTTLTSVELFDENGQYTYSGNISDLYWNVTDYNNHYYSFSFRNGISTYYLKPGDNNASVGPVKTATGEYGWGGYDEFVHTGPNPGRCLQCSDGTFRVWDITDGQGNNRPHWEDYSRVYFMNGAPVQNRATVHHGYMEGGHFVELQQNPAPVDVDLNQDAYLIYDFSGYQYAGEAYYLKNEPTNGNPTTGKAISPELMHDSGTWQTFKGEIAHNPRYPYVFDQFYNMLNGTSYPQFEKTNPSAVENDSHIYVLYEKKANNTTGGTPKPEPIGEGNKPADPTFKKTSEDNNDRTRTISLSVKAPSVPAKLEKLADVIVVLDVSGSMNFTMNGETPGYFDSSRIDLAKQAVKNLAQNLLNKKNSKNEKTVRMAVVPFSNDVIGDKVIDFTDNLTTFNSGIDALYADGGTNWEAALQYANTMAVDPDRATFVVFVTDGDPTLRKTRGNMTDGDLMELEKIEGGAYYHGITDNLYSRYGVFGSGGTDEKSHNYNAALAVAKEITKDDAKKNFYSIAISSDTEKLGAFTSQAGGLENFTATTSEGMTQVFDKIAELVNARLGWGDVQINDGITSLTSILSKRTDLVGVGDEFTYWKGHQYNPEKDAGKTPDADGIVWEEWNPASEDAQPAEYKDGAVQWNMGPDFMPEDGYTYQVRFLVWPSQKAYDYLAKINNAENPDAEFEKLDSTIKKQFQKETDGSYTLITNEEDAGATAKYAARSGESITVVEDPAGYSYTFPPVENLILDKDKMGIKKEWNYIDSTRPNTITMAAVTEEEEEFKRVVLTKAGNWEANNIYISCGLMKVDENTGDVIVLENGHDFVLTEPIAEERIYWELTSGTYHPMVINAEPVMLSLVDETPDGMGDKEYYKVGDKKYYRLANKVYEAVASGSKLTGMNDHRSYLDLTKVLENSTQTDQLFTFNVKITDARGEDIIFSVKGDGQNYLENVTTTATPDHDSSGNAYYVAESGEAFTVSIKPGWNIRFLNLSNNSDYEIEEININENFDFVKAEASAIEVISTKQLDGTYTQETRTISPGTTIAGKKVSGKIDGANRGYKVVYTNKAETRHVIILKKNQDMSLPLAGAKFDLYTKSAYESSPRGTAFKTNLVSSSEQGKEGYVDLGELLIGEYYLVETSAPKGYLLADPILLTVYKNKVSLVQNNSIRTDTDTDDDKIYMLAVTNTDGTELPHTGGPGTRLFTILGTMLITFGAAMLLFRRQTR